MVKDETPLRGTLNIETMDNCRALSAPPRLYKHAGPERWFVLFRQVSTPTVCVVQNITKVKTIDSKPQENNNNNMQPSVNVNFSVCMVLLGICVGVHCAPGSRNDAIVHRNACNCVCGVSNRQMRVVGGNTTKVHEFPWIAGLSKSGEFYCGASLITRKHVLTAAHCVNGFDVRTISVVLADHDRNAPNRLGSTVVRGVRRARQHRAFDKVSYNNDIAVLELDAPVEFGPKVQTACLPTGGDDAYAGRLAVVAGWGKTDERGKVSHILRKAAVPVWAKKDCYDAGYGSKRLSENMFCAGYPDGGKDACQGDSGGPLHMKTDEGNMELIGLVSWGRGCGRPNLPGVYTKISNYIDWVSESLNGECLCPPPLHVPRHA